MTQQNITIENSSETLPTHRRPVGRKIWLLFGGTATAVSSLVACNVPPPPPPPETTTTTSSTIFDPSTANGEREADLNELHDRLEQQRIWNGKYPTLDNLNDYTWNVANLKDAEFNDFDSEMLRDPADQSYPTQLAQVPTTGKYSYEVDPPGCDNFVQDCTSFVVTAVLDPADAGAMYRRVSSTLEPPTTTTG